MTYTVNQMMMAIGKERGHYGKENDSPCDWKS